MSLTAENISVQIAGCYLVKDASLTLARGECVALIGPNGAGKSTLLKTILGLMTDARGRVHCDGDNLASLPPKRRARRIAYLPQSQVVEWDINAHDVVTLGRAPYAGRLGKPGQACHAAIDTALEAVDLMGLATRRFSVLSGGEAARVLLARALATQAPYLLADEPVAALDVYHQLHVMEILRAQAMIGTGVLAVMHDVTLAARFFDRVIIMKDGQIIKDGPPKTVLNSKLLERIYGVTSLSGTQDGQDWLLPWSRIYG